MLCSLGAYVELCYGRNNPSAGIDTFSIPFVVLTMGEAENGAGEERDKCEDVCEMHVACEVWW